MGSRGSAAGQDELPQRDPQRGGPEGALELGQVCASLERSGGALSSGMCFDAIDLNQTMAAYQTKEWPGYVSCDAASGLSTVSGIVCPIRGGAQRVIAVWDLDATQVIDPADVRTMDVLFSTLSRCKAITPGDFFPEDTA